MNLSLKDRIRNVLSGLRYRLAKFLKAAGDTTRLSDRNWKWISWGSLFFILLFGLGFVIFLSGEIAFGWIIFGFFLIILLPLLYGGLIKLGLLIARKIPVKLGWFTLSALTVLIIFLRVSFKTTTIHVFYLFLTVIFLSGALSNIAPRIWKTISKAQRLLTIFFLTLGFANLIIVIYFFSYPGKSSEDRENHPFAATLIPDTLPLTDPSEFGSYNVETFFYGSGSDRQREEFSGELSLVSQSVDGSNLIEGWDKWTGKIRSAYWGFNSDSLPLNGRVWMPDGPGRFPVVLIVHGNHLSRDFSDEGYEYLGDLLASQGNITISVDQNFLNGGLTNFRKPLQEENDARGWLLLKHLEQIDEWNKDSSTRFYGKADLENVLLIGHSRGGEAVCIAAAFNSLPFYPDNAKEEFDFGYGIKGVVAIAQVDGQYHPSNQQTPLSNINFLAIQGSMDADLDSYSGLRMMNRIRFTDSLFHFKTGIYIERANHGQFNESWGTNDIGYPIGLFLNRKKLISKEAQEKIAKTYIAAFARTNLQKDYRYLDFFRDYRTGRDWIPRLEYQSQYQDSKSYIVADFEEDLDLTTASRVEATITFQDLASIYEEKVYLKKGNSGTKSACIGWNNSRDSVPGIYRINFNISPEVDQKALTLLQFDVAVIDRDPGDREKTEDEDSEYADEEDIEDSTVNEIAEELDNPDENDDDTEKEPVLFSIHIIDRKEDTARVSLESFFPLNQPIPTNIYKLKVFERNSNPEVVPQHIEIPLQAFKDAHQAIDLEEIRLIEFVFDKGEKGMIALDNIGFSTAE